MSKSIGAALQSHLETGETTLAICVKITRNDNEVFGFTDHDKELTVDTVTYRPIIGVETSAAETQAGLNVDQLEMRGFLDALGVTEAEISAGLWDQADIRVFQVNWANTSQGTIKLRRGWLGEVSVTQEFRAELRGVAQKLQQSIIELVSEYCKADLFDSRCGLTATEGSTKFTGVSVSSIVSAQRQFISLSGSPSISGLASDFFSGGKILWTTGSNASLQMEIKTHSLGSPNGANITLVQAMPYEILVGDEFTIFAGCRKRYVEDCGTKFNNQENFRGFPHLPGLDEVLKGPH